MTPGVAAIFAACIVIGFGLTYLAGVGLRFEERVAFGAVLGMMATTVTGYVVGSSFGFGGTSVTVGVIAGAVLSGPGWWLGRHRFGGEWRELVARIGDRRDPANPWPLVAILVPSWILAIRILRLAYRPTGDGGLLAGHLASWTDWQAHLAYSSSFAFGGNVADLPIATGSRLNYHFGLDYFAAMLVPTGIDPTTALQLSSGFLAFAFPAVLYLAALRITERRLAAAIATLLFVSFGGLGWARFVGDVRADGWAILDRLPRTYTRDPAEHYWIENPVIGHLFPQRPTLVGFSVVLIVVTLLLLGRRSDDRRAFLFAGLLVGIAPIFHVFGFGTSLVLGLVWAAMDRRRIWLWFVVPAIGLSVPGIAWLLPETSSFELGLWYRSEQIALGDVENPVSFWLKNLGLFLPLVIVAHISLPPRLRWAFAPVWLWFLVPNVVLPHPWDGNNTHYFVFFVLFGSIAVGRLLAEHARVTVFGAVLAAGAFASMTAAGGLDIWAAAHGTTELMPTNLMSGADLAAGHWVRDNLPDDAVVVVSPDTHQQPIPGVGAKKVVSGSFGWVHDLGVGDATDRWQASRMILAGEPGTDDLLARYDVDYVVIGPYELQLGADPAYWAARAPVVYERSGYTIYEVGA